MFSSSIRRVARSVPVTATPSRTLVTPAVLATNSHGLFATKKHQRRNSSSSSKPPVPPSDGSRGIDVGAPNKDVAQGSEKKAGRRKAAKDGQEASGKKNDPFVNVPSVPSTQHLHPHDVHVASFFSIHRPMSVTTSVPGNSNADVFSSIFNSGTSKKATKPSPSDVIFTLSSAVDTLESATSQTHQEDAQSSEGVTHLDGTPFADMKISVEEITRSFRPFNPPPPPEPMSMEESNSAAIEAEQQAQDSLESYSSVLTIRERFDESGERTWDAHTTPFVKIEEPTTEFEEHQAPAMAPHGSFTRRMQREKMQAISVKRQRKLKMKKHKYKKLMRKTRSLRKRLDKA